MTLWQDDKGHTSAMRVIAVCGAFCGILGVAASVVGMFLKLPSAVGMAGICAGLTTTAMGLKWAQKREEVKTP